MASYYTFVTKDIKLRLDTPVEVLTFLNGAMNGNIPDIVTIDHDLFNTDGWAYIFDGCISDVKGYYKHTEGKNAVLKIVTEFVSRYGDIIDLFADWIKPYVTGHKPKEYIGHWYTDYRDSLDKYSNIYINR